MYKLETHCHSSVISKCSKLTPENLVELYISNGYNGVIITEHFLNSSACKVMQDFGSADYKTKIEKFCEGYKRLKEVANGRLDIFFGLEFSYKGTDMLVYGLDEQQLKEMPEILQMSMRDFIDFAKANNALVVHAHPFREDYYIDHIRLYPNVEGVEVYNACRTQLCNSLGENYAKAYGKIRTAGSDSHNALQPVLAGMEFDEKVLSERHFIELVRAGKGKIFYKNNQII